MKGSIKKAVVYGAIEAVAIMLIIVLIGLAGYKPSVIISKSMEPKLMTNALIITKQVPYKNIKVGDIIKFKTTEAGPVAVMHRVIRKTTVNDEIILKTKGDNNKLEDSWVVNKRDYQVKVIGQANALAPVITMLFGNLVNISMPRVITVSLILVIVIMLILGSITQSVKSLIRKG